MNDLRFLPALLSLLCLALAGCGAQEAGEEPTADTGEVPAAEAGCRQVEAPEPRPEGELSAPRERLDPDQRHVATVKTSCGDFEIELDVERAPKTTSSFAALAERDFYDGLTFHRVEPGFVIQGGDPQGVGIGGPGYDITEEPPGDLTYDRGTVAMAKAGDDPPGTSGSQFFVTVEASELPAEYALLGKVTSGMETVDRIAVVEADEQSRPTQPVVIDDITIESS